MPNELICNISLFTLDQTFILPDGKKMKININDINNLVPQICFSHNIPTVHFYGDESYIDGLIEEISCRITTEYSDKNLMFEVN